MRGYWVVWTTGPLEEGNTRSARLSAASLDNFASALWKDFDRNGTEFHYAVWHSKDQQTSGEAPAWEINCRAEHTPEGCDDCDASVATTDLERYSNGGGIAVLCEACATKRWPDDEREGN